MKTAVILCLLTGATLTMASAVAQAEDEFAPATAIVKFADLDIASAEGANVLYRRIRNAANQVCKPLESRDLGLARHWKSCVANAISTAVREVDRPRLTAVYVQAVRNDG